MKQLIHTFNGVPNTSPIAPGLIGIDLANSNVYISRVVNGTYVWGDPMGDGAGGLENWSENDDGTSAILTPAADRDAVLSPSPNKALRMDTGGDARGAGAVDLQTERASSDQVAAGAGSAILAGRNNRITQDVRKTLIAAAENCTATESTQYNVIAASFDSVMGNETDDWSNYSTMSSTAGSTVSGSYLCTILAAANSKISDAYESVILGSYNTIESGSIWCFISGTNNTITGTSSWGSHASGIVGSDRVTITDGYCTSAIGSVNVTLNGECSVAVGAQNGFSTGNHSVITGHTPTDRGINGAFVFAGDNNLSNINPGAFQSVRYNLGQRSRDASPVPLVTRDGGSPTSGTRIRFTDKGAYAMSGMIVSQSDTDAKAWRGQWLIRVDSNGMAFVGTPVLEVISGTSGADTWDLTVAIENDSLELTAHGPAGKDVYWSGYLDSAESAPADW